jgi:hypothetical protein
VDGSSQEREEKNVCHFQFRFERNEKYQKFVVNFTSPLCKSTLSLFVIEIQMKQSAI